MSRYYNSELDEIKAGILVRDILLGAVFVIASGMYGCPQYSVWQQGLAGQAELNKATQNRQITIQEAHAKRDAAKALAEAEIIRANGVASANQIIGDSLKGNDSYLRYLWITEVAANQQGKTTVYIPTEANLPILEAGRLAK